MNEKEATELYKLAKFICSKNNINYDEDLIQELVFHAFLKSNLYDETKGTWSTFICNCMENKIKDLFKNKTSKKRCNGLTEYSLDYKNENELYFQEILPCNINTRDEISQKELIRAISPLIEKPLRLHMNGYTQKEIGKLMGYSQSTICNLIKKNIQRIKQYCLDNDLYNSYKS